MKLYCEIEEKFGVKSIKRGPCALPQNTASVSNFDQITDLRVLKMHGWLPYSKITEDKQIVTGSNIVILEDAVQETVFTRDETFEEKEEKAWKIIREERDRLLKETDIHTLGDRWAVLEDSERDQLTIYRQALRELPQTYQRSSDVIWPNKV
jgi:hypothetical protein